ncbi:MAG: HD domain-containing protein [Humidesulfovibrio sp.]|nr:HD domain-containing protein [Humidesulfovibrio sp.]
MSQPFKDAVGLCKTIMRNGYDAYVINARLQKSFLAEVGSELAMDISTELDFEGLKRLFPTIEVCNADGVVGFLRQGEGCFFFHPAAVEDGGHPEECVARLTPRLLKLLQEKGEIPISAACPYLPAPQEQDHGLMFDSGEVRIKGFPDQALKRDYLLAVRVMRFAANYHLTIEPNTWLAIIRGARRVLDYCPVSDIMDEWRKVEAENMHAFVQLLLECQILHGLLPEIAALARVKQIKNPEEGEETVFAHTILVMQHYPEVLPYDWYGTLACMFHDVGKLYTAEYSEGQWSFLQHHRVGAKVTRKILTRLHFPPEDIDLICTLVRDHMRPHFMLTDKGMRRLKAIDEYPRILEMVRADIKARNASYREFNHNLKMLERGDTPEEALEPYLNGRDIMLATGLQPGPTVGMIRDALLKAQIAGDVTNIEEAKAFVVRYAREEGLVG